MGAAAAPGVGLTVTAAVLGGTQVHDPFLSPLRETKIKVSGFAALTQRVLASPSETFHPRKDLSLSFPLCLLPMYLLDVLLFF